MTPSLRSWLWPRWVEVGAGAAPRLIHDRSGLGSGRRLHLRRDADGSGVLVIDASALVRLSPSGRMLADEILSGRADEAAIAAVVATFRGARPDRVRGDLARLRATLAGFGSAGLPIANLTDPAAGPAAGAEPITAELDVLTEERMRPLLERLWDAGIPHAIFRLTNGTTDVEAAIRHAEDLGLVTGLRARAGALAGDLVDRLIAAGLDHLDLYWAGADADIHDGLFGDGDHAAASRLFARALELPRVATIPLVEATVPGLPASFAQLESHGIGDAMVFAVAAPEGWPDDERSGALAAKALPQVAAMVEEESGLRTLRVVWAPPVRRQSALPLPSQVRSGPRTASDLALRIEADGAVLPARGPRRSAGNILTNPWPAIWGHDAFRLYRQRLAAPTRCGPCPGLAVCAADCPASPVGWSE